MAKVTSKRQVTIPKEIADRYGIREGDDLGFEPAGEVIRVVPGGVTAPPIPVTERLRLFDAATVRQRERESAQAGHGQDTERRGWTREELYGRGGSR